MREDTQGWTDAQTVMSLVMLNLAGGWSVDDLRVLEKDEGLGRVLLMAELHRMRRAERRTQHNRWRRKRRRTVPSPTAVFRYLDRFHDQAEEAGRRPHRAFIPASNDALRGLRRVNADLVGFAGSHSGHTEATLDPVSSTGQAMDATLIGTHKRQAGYCYKKDKAYQPLTTYWYEADLAVRFGVICIAGRVVRHARRLIIRLTRGHPAHELLVGARRRIHALATTSLRA